MAVKCTGSAYIIQLERVANGKRGYAKAVRRWLMSNYGDWYARNEVKQELPVYWPNDVMEKDDE